ncbi:WD repeat-containing protein 1 isoform X2 [Chanos chanos]|uniref:WD repeat-containing protein 1 isoform X2 n=1 Tax=Chanos chanos TaxID=29144 RepID=A0A6J2UKU2_CHACN|nr:WD repeat-containing protein 1 isoform X2 [Chanos chanos]
MSYELKHVFASLPQMERGVAKVLGGDPKGNNFLYTNGKSVIIRNIDDHSRFVNCVRFSPDGNRYVSAGADGQIFIYDGKTGEKIGTLGGAKAHEGGIYAVSWSADSTQLISASGDKTVKLWDMATATAVTTFNMGPDVLDQQLGCLWQKNHLLSISLSGYINYLDKNNPDRPLRTVKGHSKSIQSLTVHKNEGRSYIYSGSHDGHINYWDAETGDNDEFLGKGHSNSVAKMTVDETNQLVTCSMDDTVRFTSLSKKEYSASDAVKMDVQPKCVSVSSGGLALAVCIGQLVLLKDKKKLFTLDNLGYEPEAGALHPGGTTAAVGGSDGKVRLYSVQSNTLKDEGKVLDAQGPVTDMAYSNDGAFLAVTDEKKVITVFSVADGYQVKNEFYGHHAKVVCISWCPDNDHFATGGMDMMVYVWTVNDPDKRIKIPDSHRLHHVSGLAWIDGHTLVTTSHDASVKQWTLKI